MTAAEQWPSQGMPANPVAWLVSTGHLDAARVHYHSAIALVRQEPERRLLLRRLSELGS